MAESHDDSKGHKRAKESEENSHYESPTNLKFPLTSDGTTLHLNIKRGDVANRIFTVGDLHRAWKLS